MRLFRKRRTDRRWGPPAAAVVVGVPDVIQSSNWRYNEKCSQLRYPAEQYNFVGEQRRSYEDVCEHTRNSWDESTHIRFFLVDRMLLCNSTLSRSLRFISAQRNPPPRLQNEQTYTIS